MPYTGGSSTNAGVYYQNWFLALLYSYAYFEQDYIIFPEALRSSTVVIDDIVVKSKTKNYYYSSKFRSPSTNHHWAHSNLCSEGILNDFKEQLLLNPNAQITLISENGCYLFSEVFARAKNALGSFDIHEKLESKHAIKEWESAKTHLECDDFQMINFAKSVNIKVIPVEELKFLIKHRFRHVTNENNVSALLFDKAVEASSLKTTVNKITINEWFLEHDIKIFSQL